MEPSFWRKHTILQEYRGLAISAETQFSYKILQSKGSGEGKHEMHIVIKLHTTEHFWNSMLYTALYPGRQKSS
jgi:hypothetical protein